MGLGLMVYWFRVDGVDLGLMVHGRVADQQERDLLVLNLRDLQLRLLLRLLVGFRV